MLQFEGGRPTALSNIRQIDYTVIFARDIQAMRGFYEQTMGFALTRTLGTGWFEYELGSTTLALAVRDSQPTPSNLPSTQLAFRVPPAAVTACARELEDKGVALSSSLTDHPFGHRTIFFRDPDGNLIEIYAEI